MAASLSKILSASLRLSAASLAGSPCAHEYHHYQSLITIPQSTTLDQKFPIHLFVFFSIRVSNIVPREAHRRVRQVIQFSALQSLFPRFPLLYARSSRIAPMKRLACLLMVLPLLVTACVTLQPVATSTPTPSLPPTQVPTMPSPTQAPALAPTSPTATPTPLTVDGTLTIKVNVRSGPGTTYASLGQLDAGEKVQVMVQDATGALVPHPLPGCPGRDRLGVRPICPGCRRGTGPAGCHAHSTRSDQGACCSSLNVRSGPGMTFDSLGMLQTEYDGLPDRQGCHRLLVPDRLSGWPGRARLGYRPIHPDGCLRRTAGAGRLRYAGGQRHGRAWSPDLQPPTSTVGPAFADGDSAANPAVHVTFSATGTRQFTYSGQVSAPQGDPEDWVEFTPFAVNASEATLVFSLACTGNGTLTVEMEQAGALLSGWGSLACGDLDKSITLPAGQPYRVASGPCSGRRAAAGELRSDGAEYP